MGVSFVLGLLSGGIIGAQFCKLQMGCKPHTLDFEVGAAFVNLVVYLAIHACCPQGLQTWFISTKTTDVKFSFPDISKVVVAFAEIVATF